MNFDKWFTEDPDLYAEPEPLPECCMDGCTEPAVQHEDHGLCRDHAMYLSMAFGPDYDILAEIAEGGL